MFIDRWCNLVCNITVKDLCQYYAIKILYISISQNLKTKLRTVWLAKLIFITNLKLINSATTFSGK